MSLYGPLYQTQIAFKVAQIECITWKYLYFHPLMANITHYEYSAPYLPLLLTQGQQKYQAT